MGMLGVINKGRDIVFGFDCQEGFKNVGRFYLRLKIVPKSCLGSS